MKEGWNIYFTHEDLSISIQRDFQSGRAISSVISFLHSVDVMPRAPVPLLRSGLRH